jgi:holo-[acyl-carrier protein] synthase
MAADVRCQVHQSRFLTILCHHEGRMIVGMGADVVEVNRIRESISRFGERFLDRVYTEGERAYSQSKANAAERFAARFAAKEAGMKAVGTGWNLGVTWKDFEVVNERSGRPTLSLHGTAEKIARRLGAGHISISLTHTREMALAIVILESGG